MDKGEECMREQLGFNSYQCMQYNEYCMKCYKKVYAKEYAKDMKALQKEIEGKQKFMQQLKKGIKSKVV